MKVTFTRRDGRRYAVAIERERGPRLVPRDGPGYDDFMPHDLAHYLVEEQLGIGLGVFGQFAAGGGGLLAPVPAARSESERRRVRRIAALGRKDICRSEKAVGRCMAEWQVRVGRPRLPIFVDDDVVTPAELERVVARIDEVARRWHALPVAASMTFCWRPVGRRSGRKQISGSPSAPIRRHAPR